VKSLKDLADEWGENLHISYNRKVWAISFLYSQPFIGHGPTFEAAVISYVAKIRGKELKFKYSDLTCLNRDDQVRQVPEILTSDL
jgi:hypothetical protein